MRNFGTIHSFIISENENFTKTKNGKKFLIEYISLVKNNKFLSEHMHLMNAIEDGICISESEKNLYLSKVISIMEGFTLKDMTIANKKLGNILDRYLTEEQKTSLDTFTSKYDIIGGAVETIIRENKSIANLTQLVEAKNTISNALTIKESVSLGEKTLMEIDPDILSDKLIHGFNKKYEGALEEDDKKLLKSIIEASTNEDRSVILNTIKSECIGNVNTLIKECNNITLKEKLLSLKEMLLNEDNESESYIGKTLKLIEKRDVLRELKG